MSDSASDEDEFDLDQPKLEKEDALMYHVVLPRVLPDKSSEFLHKAESDMINYMVKISLEWERWMPPETVQMLRKLRNFHDECIWEIVKRDINCLKPGENFAIFVRAQHCGMMIHVPLTEMIGNVENVIVSTFPGRLDAKEIYSHDSDIEFNYPERAINVKFSEMLRSSEFSQQLCVLSENLPIGYKRLDCVSKWLITLLMDEQSTVANETEFPIITKKIRDEAWGSIEDNFRRSSFYLSIKAMIQHSLRFQMNFGAGKSLYKIFMLKFLVDTCEPYKKEKVFNIDLLSQMIAKIARRIEKLSTMMIADDLENLCDQTIREAKKTIQKIRQKIDKQIKRKYKLDKNLSKLAVLKGLELNEDSKYNMEVMKELDEYLKKRTQNATDEAGNNGFKPPANITYERYFKYIFVPDIEIATKIKSGIDQRIFWMDFERVVLHEMKVGDDQLICKDLRSWSFEYAKFAEKSYKNNPLFISRMLLVRLKLIAMLDDQATKKYPMLLQHKSGINENMINYFLLPQSTDMRHAFELEKYFRDRNEDAIDPSLIGQKQVSDSSFAVKFAREDLNMQQIRNEILDKDNEKVEKRRAERDKGRRKVEELRSEANSMDHEYIPQRNRQSKRCSDTCKRCVIQRKVNDVSIKQYEHLLPQKEMMQFAIVFELQIPEEIACLRDVLCIFGEFCHGEPKQMQIKVKYNDRLTDFNKSSSEHVGLGSTTKPTLNNISVDSSLKQIIVQNTFNCMYYGHENGKKKAIPSHTSILPVKKHCTLEAKDEYISLQWALYSTEHNENKVLASQSKCGTNLTLSEYKNFGTLRSDGHRLQIRKLYAMIETESLSFEKEGVLALVMQTLWECEVSGEADYVRESHIDFRDAKFCDAMIELLQKFVEQQKNNWVYPFKLLTATLIAVRAFEINEVAALANKIVKLLSSIRNIAWEWIRKIETAIRDMVNPDENTERNLRLKLIYVSIIGGLTFFIHPTNKYYDSIFSGNLESKEAVQSWLLFIISLTNNIRMYTNNEEQLPSNLCMLIRLMESIGVSLEDKVTEVIERDAEFIFALIKRQWPRSEFAIFSNIDFNDEFPQILDVVATIDGIEQTVTIDIITGTFLVDSLPLSRLPNEVIHSESYRWFFEDVVFEVQPDAQHNFSTKNKYNNCTYEFKMIGDEIIIIERNGNVEKELINQNLFNNHFPYYLVQNYSHWWNRNEDCIEFRLRTSGEKHFSKETTIDYCLNIASQRLIHVPTHFPMLYIGSDSYKHITQQLSRLEHAKYIHVLYKEVDDDVSEAKVECLRMNLKFTVECSKKSRAHSDLISNEFKGMRVIRDQNINTLCGLNNGLILQNQDDDSKILLIPNGTVETQIEDTFASVSIKNKDNLRNPPFYQYQVDKFCCQLKSSNGSYASWFYLAYLHALTSNGEIEPFSGMSGTERAIQILGQSFAWSSEPYERGAVKILRDIASLTPIRELKDEYMSVTWPNNIPTRSAQDCFGFIAKKLLDDSQRLHGFYSKNPEKKIELDTSMKFNERDHRRCQQLNPNLNVPNTFIERRVLRTSPPRDDSDRLSDETRTVCMLYHMQKFKIPSSKFDLKQFLTGKAKSLDGTGNVNRIKDLLSHCTHKEFRDLWIPLYDAAIKKTFNSQEFAIILSFYAHKSEEDVNEILALQAIALNPEQFVMIKPPVRKSFQISFGTFVGKTVTAMLKKCHTKPVQYNSKEWRESGQRNRYDMHLETIIDDLTATVKNDWSKSAVSVSFKNKWPEFTDFDFARANLAVNERLEIWNANRQLFNFIKNVEMRLQSLSGCSVRKSQCIMPLIKPKRWSKMSIDFDTKLNKNYESFNEQIEEAKNIWLTNTSDSHRSASDWLKVYKKMCKSSATSHLIEAGIFPRMVPSLILPKIMDTNLDDNLRCMIGAFGIVITREQRELRIEAYKQRSDLRAALEKEETNQPHENWLPREYPEWLLFEIEQNLTIRRIQIEIAKRMIDPPGKDIKHAVMQLNMGEGKTAVIVPILAAKLADGTQACQIIVLKSLFATNLKSLRQYLGGLLNRRIYLFPCRRDMPIESHAHTILDIYEECKREKGVILTLPEYRLSAQLKIYESIALQLKIDEKGNFTTTKNLLDLFNWANVNLRTILDESDAILQPKYQLIYTVGDQLQPDGNSQRWLVPQALLKRVPFHMNRLYAKYGKEKVEFGQEYDDNRTDIFTPCRILDDIVFEALKDALIDDLFAGRVDIDFPGIDESKQPSMKHLLSNKAMESNARKMIEEFSEENQNIIYILSGLLRFEVLKLALTKRWRVNYGVDVKSTRKMAIPFKAKDVASELTEFGHPDVAVCFTQISYYYSGLSEKQLYHVFNLLENSPDAANIYAKWINSIPSELIIPSIKSYNGVNLDDPEQRDGILFPLFKYNMYVIDFWLCNVVYQQELKIFEKKLMCTAWDLCSKKFNHRVTGFSGTNDTKNILPITIAQNDLEELENTNEEMRQILLDPRNCVFEKPANVTGKQILQKLHQKEISVLLDSGALMLELNNKEVAIEWLKLASGCSAAIYFDENDTLQTIDRDGIVVEFDYSVYREDLSNCVVYLDDVHTRGTDLKFPSHWQACVTLSGDITRDKTVQSCMRMRQLKTTQSILFWASHEADIRLRELSGQRKVESKHVMEFIEKNSRTFESANMAHWTAGAVNYTEKILGHAVYEDPKENENGGSKLEQLYNFCVDNDFIELKKMYGEKEEELLYMIAWNKFHELERKYDKLEYDREEEFINEIKGAVRRKLKTMVPKMKRFTHSSSLDEEQEKELEQEIEEQQQIERPPDAEPAQPIFDSRLKKLVLDGITIDGPFNEMKVDEKLLSIVASLSNTQMSELCKDNEDAWASHLFVTKDFTTVIENLSQACNDFLRPVRWIARIKNPNDKDILILLSSFECNQLIPAFRMSVNATLFMYHPRLSNLHSNLIHETALQLTAMQQTNPIEVNDEVQIGVYAGLMYFSDDEEQRAYCEFLGLVPRPWTQEQRNAHKGGIIEENGYVPIIKRNYVETVSQCVSQCKFKSNPTDLAIKLIKAHHQMLPKDSHVASILNRGIKSFAEDDSMETE